MDELIATLSETFLWESVSSYVEEVAEITEILKGIGYIDHEVFKEVKKAEIFESDEFIVEDVKESSDKYWIFFQMPVILIFYDSKEQTLRVTTNIIGNCYIADKDHYDWNQHDFESMNRLELLLHKDLVQDIQCEYQDVECDDLRVG